ncbi:MAG: hypothetical protein WC725_02415 [Patescibacteria group bacterium]|jgi:hypothetical protein
MINKRKLAYASVLLFFALGVGCPKIKNPLQVGKKGPAANEQTPVQVSPEVADDADQIFEDPSTRVSFHYQGYLQKTDVKMASGSVSVVFKRRAGSTRTIDTLYFSAKTKDAYLLEKKNAPKDLVCDNYTKPGCDKWEEDLILYNRAMSQNNFDGYYAFGGNRMTLNGITYVVVVDYNLERQQYQTKYIAFINNTRIMFVDPATGGLEYGIPFQMNAKNRELIEKTGLNLAKRQKIDDMKTVVRADALFQIVATTKLMK